MTRKPRLLVLTPDYPPSVGGIQTLMWRFVAHLTRLDPTVVALAVDGNGAFDASQTIHVERSMHAPRLGRIANIAIFNARALSVGLRQRPDIVLSGHLVASPAAWALGRILRRPYVQYVYGREVVHRPRLAAFGLRHAKAVIAISRYTSDLALAHGCDPSKIRVVPPGVDVPATSEWTRKATGMVISVARLNQRYKGHDVLIRAMPLVRREVPEARLFIVGDGVQRGAYQELIESLGATAYVHLLGRLPDDERDRLLDEANVFAMPSRLPPDGGGEGFGIVYLEVGARGLPVVAGAVAGALDAVVQGKTGLLVDPTDHRAVATALAKLLADPTWAASLGRAALDHCRKYRWPVVTQRIEDMLLTIAGR